MKIAFTVIALALACGGVLAQAPAGVVRTPSNQQDPTMSGGKAQAKGEMNAEAKGSMAAGGKMAMGKNPMDTNGDGMVSRAEWNAYHNRMWGTMKPNKQGMVPWNDVESAMKAGGGGGPN